ncbi:MAG: helix-turn-helix transcriptional regulator [Gammaproteobacteria bacterium]|nr:helix-turn-helix transcriptional regulator [Gammaproteobacteria bacterium]
MTLRLQLSWLANDGQVRADMELIALLDAVAATGKLTEAAQQIGCSYRHAWDRLKSISRATGKPPVVLTRGRGAQLTATGEELRQTWRRLDAACQDQLQALALPYVDRLAQLLERSATRETHLNIAASHSFVLVALANLLPECGGLTVDLHNHGSCRSLEMLARQQCDIAGFHLPLGPLGQRLTPVIGRCLDPRRHRLLELETRAQGFILGANVVLDDVRDLASRRLRFVNRQPGAGSRMILDLLLADAGIAPAWIRGYTDEEHTHTAVGALIASGAAEVGFGVETAARRFNLRFVPVVRERYFLVLPRSDRGRGWLTAIRTTLAATAFRDELARMPAVDIGAAGTLHEDFDLDMLWRQQP